MSTIPHTAELVQAAISQRRNVSILKNCWTAFQEWRKWERLRHDLCSLSDQELMDIGIARGEIEYVASHRDSDPRGIRSSEWLRRLPTVDGQIGPASVHSEP
jgi:uncharacterized protein YjiS (DUF1127 family)